MRLAIAEPSPAHVVRLIRLEVDACLADQREAIERAVRVEDGDPASADDPDAVIVRVHCVPAGADAGVVLEIERPGTPRRYRYALDWTAQPPDARPRLLGLAITEAVDASRIELTALPEPAVAAPGVTPPSSATSFDWSLAFIAGTRTFSAPAGISLRGAGLMPSRQLTAHLRIAADATVEIASVPASQGVVTASSISSAPRLILGAGGRVRGEIGVGGRIGLVVIHGTAPSGSLFVGRTEVRPWLGPSATAAAGIALTPRVVASANVELGRIALGVTGRDVLEPVAVIGGSWTAVGLTIAIAL